MRAETRTADGDWNLDVKLETSLSGNRSYMSTPLELPSAKTSSRVTS